MSEPKHNCNDCIKESVCEWAVYSEDIICNYFVDKKVLERPQGEWIKGREISRTMIGDKIQHIEYKDYTCSNCGLVLDNLLYRQDGSPFYKFCPNCGARMEVENICQEE